MNYLITGGTGLIGRALIKKLSTQSSTLTVLTRDIKQAQKLTTATNVKFIDSLTLEQIENKNTVINLAGEPIADKRWSNSQKHKICNSRWLITQQLVDFIKQATNPPSLFISGSAVGMYGRQKNKRIDETFTNYHHEFTHDVCAKWEQIAKTAQSDKTRVAILRTGIVLAPNGGALAKMLLPFKLGLGGKISSGMQYMSWIHIDDMVDAIIFINNNKQLNGVINLTAKAPVTNKVFTTELAKALNRPSLFTTPAPILKLVLGELADLIIYGQNVVPTKLIANHFKFSYPTLELALDNLLNQH